MSRDGRQPGVAVHHRQHPAQHVRRQPVGEQLLRGRGGGRALDLAAQTPVCVADARGQQGRHVHRQQGVAIEIVVRLGHGGYRTSFGSASAEIALWLLGRLSRLSRKSVAVRHTVCPAHTSWIWKRLPSFRTTTT